MVYIFYRADTEHERLADEFYERLKAEKVEVEMIDADSREGAAKAQAYGLMRLPVVLVVRHDGSVVKDWQGDMLPTVSDVAFFARSGL